MPSGMKNVDAGRDARRGEVGEGLSPSLLIDQAETCRLCGGISPRTLRRLVDRQAAPLPVRLGKCLKWRRAEIESWISGGCKPARKGR